MNYEEYIQISEEIPSGDESEEFEEDGVDCIEDQPQKIVELIDNVSESESEQYSDDDEIPLAELKTKLNVDSFVWRRVVSNYTAPANFSEEYGCCNIPEEVNLPIEVFSTLFPNTFFEHIVHETNLYATQATTSSGKPFHATNIGEIKIFFAINILMGIKHLPSYRDFWSTKLELRDSYISSLMPRVRFDWLLGNLHLNDNILQPKRGDPGYDKLYKVRPLLKLLSETFSKYYKPSKSVSVDESMIKFKGRVSFRQYMPNKPIKRGYKVWVRASSSGYIDHFQIYTGKVDNISEKNLGPRVVMDLTRSLVNKHHHVFMDNYFTSLPLLRQLRSENIYACGTIRKNRKGLPTDLIPDKRLNRGSFDWRVTDDGISFLKWIDKRVVMMVSNYHTPDLVGTVQRKTKDGENEDICCPLMIKDYNSNMGFVDKADMLKNTYEINRKSHKWWHRILWHFVDVAIVNSFIIFRERCEQRSLDLKDFRLSVVTGLVGTGTEQVRRGKPRGFATVSNFKPNIPVEKRWDKAAHMPVHSSSRRCALCSTRDAPHRTRWGCTTCKVGLCLNQKQNCFLKYHEKSY